MKTGITGATGQLGRLVVEKLKSKGAKNLVALVRSPEKAKDLGIEAIAFDYEKPETLAASLKGIEKLMLISASEVGKRAVQHENVINAAKEAGVKWIVYTSLLHADTTPISLAEEHIITEKLLKDSGIPHTILRNGWYTENYLGQVAPAISSGTLAGSAGDGKISSASREDYAEAAAVVLTTEGHQGKVYELAGDHSFTMDELAATISEHSKKPVVYKNLPAQEYAGMLAAAGLPEAFAQTLAGWDEGIAKNGLYNDSKTLSSLIGRPTTPFSETIAKNL